MLPTLVLILAGLAAGALNAVAGGGTFLTFPALVWLGVPPVMANATATMTALPGYFGSAWAYRHDIRAESALSLRQMIAISALGGLLGAVLLMVTPETGFVALVPWLLLAATALFAFGPRLVAVLARGGGMGCVGSSIVLLSVSIYGGYFNGGLGIMLLAAFGVMGFADLHGMNGLKNLLSALLSSVSAITYALAGMIAWDSALILALATTAGGYAGAHYARRLSNTNLLRTGIVIVGLAMSAAFFLL